MGVRLVVGGLATAYLTAMAALVGWAVLPSALGWSTSVVESTSMAPAVRAGDALVFAPVEPGEVEVGQIVLVDDPAVAGRVLSHRVVEVLPDGSLVTKGDANPSADSTPVGADAVLGLARLRVPLVGLPRLWGSTGELWPLAAWAAGTALAVLAAATDPSRGRLRAQRGASGRPARRLLPRLRRRRTGVAVGAALGVTLLLPPALATGGAGGGLAHAAFLGTSDNGQSSFAAHPDLTAPDAGAVVIAKTGTGYLTGAVRPSGTYRVHADVTDTGNPASGVSAVTADVSAVTAGTTAAALTNTGSTVGGVSYTWQSATLTAGASTGAQGFTLTMTDAATRSRTRTGYTVTVDGVAPTAAAVDTVNKTGGTVGRPETGDALVLTYSEQIDPASVLATWTGGSQNVTVRFIVSGSTNLVTVRTSTGTLLPLGTVTSPSAYFNATANFTNSTMVQSGGTVTVTLGTTTGTPTTVTAPATLSWAPSATPFDAAGNTVTTTARTEAGASDADF